MGDFLGGNCTYTYAQCETKCKVVWLELEHIVVFRIQLPSLHYCSETRKITSNKM